MQQNGILTALFALLVMTGGLIGFFVSNSQASLVASAIFGTLYLIAALALLRGKKWGQWMALVLSLVLGAFFAKRYLELYTFIPLMMTLLSLAMAGLLVKPASALRK